MFPFFALQCLRSWWGCFVPIQGSIPMKFSGALIIGTEKRELFTGSFYPLKFIDIQLIYNSGKFNVYNMMIWYTHLLWTNYFNSVAPLSSHTVTCMCGKKFKISSLTSLQVHNTVLLTIVTLLIVYLQNLLVLQLEAYTFWPTRPTTPHPQVMATTILISFDEFSFFRFLI